MDLIQALAAELGKDPRHVENVVHLLDEGNTIPFIARYRKEATGSMQGAPRCNGRYLYAHARRAAPIPPRS